MQIHRRAVQEGVPFTAPTRITFGFQSQRGEFSIWYRSDDEDPERFRTTYIILATGQDHPEPFEILDTVVIHDEIFAYHLCRLTPSSH